MKIYDKEMYRKNESIKSALVVIVAFILGFAVGCMAINGESKIKNAELQEQNAEKQEHIIELERIIEQQEVKINEQYIELDSLRETVYMYQVYGK